MKRKHGEGSWGTKTVKEYLYHYYRSEDGKYTYGRTIKEVKEKLKSNANKPISSKTSTFKSYGMNWLRTVKALELEARTYDEYENIIENRIGNHNIGSRQLHSITSDTWQSFVNELSGKYALGTIKKTWGIIKQIVTYAEAKGDIREGTLKLVRLPKEANVAVKAKEVPFIDETDMNILYNEAFHTVGTKNRYLYGNASKLLVLIMYTGLRVSEACALKWTDIDLANKTLRVQSSLSRVKERSADRQSLKNEDGSAKYKIISKGADIKLVSELLGHSDVTFTYNVYIGVFQEDKRKAVDLLD